MQIELMNMHKKIGITFIYVTHDQEEALTMSDTIVVMRNGEIEPFYMIHQFYKWYSLINNLPGFDFNSQKLFKKYLYLKDSQGLENLKLDEMLGLQEAIARDQEATTYALELARQKQGSRKVLDKIKNDGQATI